MTVSGKYQLIHAALIAIVLMIGAVSDSRAAELVYYHSPACAYCDQWDREVGSIYDKTPESKLLKLRRVDVHEDIPADLAHIKGVVYTPTFVVVDEGREVARILGYNGDMFFWEHIGAIINKFNEEKSAKSVPCPGKGQETGENPRIAAC